MSGLGIGSAGSNIWAQTERSPESEHREPQAKYMIAHYESTINGRQEAMQILKQEFSLAIEDGLIDNLEGQRLIELLSNEKDNFTDQEKQNIMVSLKNIAANNSIKNFNYQDLDLVENILFGDLINNKGTGGKSNQSDKQLGDLILRKQVLDRNGPENAPTKNNIDE